MNKLHFAVALALSGSLGGCGFLQPPPQDDPPVKPPEPPVDLFAPNDNVTAGAKLPGTYSVIGVDASTDPDSNEVVIVRSVAVVKGPGDKDIVVPGKTTEKMRLAGVILPPKGAPGREAAVRTINGWTRGKNDLEIEGDAQYPTDLMGRRLVQIYFKGTGKDTGGKRLNLNRMLVRSGYAVVDLHQASSINPQKWFNDEQYARLRKDPNDPEHKKAAPLGLWKMGIVLGQRPPVPKPTPTPVATTAPPAGAPAPPGGAPGATPPGPGGPPPGAPTPAP